MADVLTPEQRRKCMAAILCKNTRPELQVRRIVHALGFRYALHRTDLPGKPDIVLTRHNKIIFVHGCYWHRHNCSNGSAFPSTRAEFWKSKFEGNIKRDSANRKLLNNMGWRTIIVWECELKNQRRLATRLAKFLAK